MAQSIEIIETNPIDRDLKVGGKLVAQTRRGDYPDNFRWFIVVFNYDGEPMEEVDIVATDRKFARKLAQYILDNDYEDGGVIGEVVLA